MKNLLFVLRNTKKERRTCDIFKACLEYEIALTMEKLELIEQLLDIIEKKDNDIESFIGENILDMADVFGESSMFGIYGAGEI